MEHTHRFDVASGALPGLGHAIWLWRRPLQFVSQLPSQGDLVEIRLGPMKAYMACHMDVVNQVLSDPRTFEKGGKLIDAARLLIGDGLGTCEWDEHRRQRRMMQPAFHRARMPGYAALMQAEITDALAAWQPGETLDVPAAMLAMTLRIASRAMFGTGISEQAISEVASCMPTILHGIFGRLLLPFGWLEKIPTPANRRFERALTRMRQLIREIVQDRLAAGESEGDLLSVLINTRDETTGEQLAENELHDQAMTLLIAGSETSATALSWAVRMLAEHPDVEAKLHREVDHVLAGRPPVFEDLPRLDYTWRLLQEVLRMYPPIWIMSRTTKRESSLAGRHMKPGDMVLLSPYILGHDPHLFTAPEIFDPDRWLPERAANVPRGALIPFGAGNRKCIGDSFAQVGTTLALAATAAGWHLRPTRASRAQKPVPGATLGTGNLMMAATPRKATASLTTADTEAQPPRCPHLSQPEDHTRTAR